MDCCPARIEISSSRLQRRLGALLDNRIRLGTQVTRIADVGDAIEVEMDGQGDVTVRAVFARAGLRGTAAGHARTWGWSKRQSKWIPKVLSLTDRYTRTSEATDSGDWRCGGRTDAGAQSDPSSQDCGQYAAR